MFVVLTPEYPLEKEVAYLAYFASFPKVRLHIRKPQLSQKELFAYLEQLPAEAVAQSSLHSHHDLAEHFGVGGVHFTTAFRKGLADQLENNLANWQNKGKSLSASLHSLHELKPLWDYTLLSPVFDSVSKQGYLGRAFSVAHREEKIIALGGVTERNVAKAKELGYEGIAVLGAVWKSKNPSETFKKLYDAYQNTFA